MSLASFVKAGNLFLEIVQDEKVQELAKGTWQGLQRLGAMAGEPTGFPTREQRVPFAPPGRRQNARQSQGGHIR